VAHFNVLPQFSLVGTE